MPPALDNPGHTLFWQDISSAPKKNTCHNDGPGNEGWINRIPKVLKYRNERPQDKQMTRFDHQNNDQLDAPRYNYEDMERPSCVPWLNGGFSNITPPGKQFLKFQI